MFAGALVLALGIGAWIVPFTLSETMCWTATPGPDGALVYQIVPNTDTSTVGVTGVGAAAGCDGGAFTLQGLMLGGVLAIGALAVAALGAGLAGERAG